MYEIYINDKRLILASREEVQKGTIKKEIGHELMSVPYRGNPKMFHAYIDALEKSSRMGEVVLYAEDVKALKRDFYSLYHKVPAAGGLVSNKRSELLFIFRRGVWDLPKGKIDAGEKKKEAALREVSEETGVLDLRLGNKFAKTRHTFSCKKNGFKRCLKLTHWYEMFSEQEQFTPQAEEDIEQVAWMQVDEFLQSDLPTFNSVRRLVLRWKKEGSNFRKKAKKNS